MNNPPRFSSLLVLLLLAGFLSPVPAAAQPPPSKDKAAKSRAGKKKRVAPPRRRRPLDDLRSSRARLRKLQPFRADIHETIVLRNRTFRAKGKYLQADKLKLRLEFELVVGQTKGALLQVCDGKWLWIEHTIGANSQATKRNVQRILKEMKSLNTTGPPRRPGQYVADLGLGGLDAMLASLEESMAWESRRVRMIQDRPFVVIEGTWTASFLRNLIPDGESIEDELPEYIPDRVRIYFDQATEFPRRLEYLKKQRGRESYRPMVTLEFRNVEINVKLDNGDFEYKQDAKVRVQDVTDAFIRQLREFQKQAGAKAGAKSKKGSAKKTGSRR